MPKKQNKEGQGDFLFLLIKRKKNHNAKNANKKGQGDRKGKMKMGTNNLKSLQTLMYLQIHNYHKLLND